MSQKANRQSGVVGWGIAGVMTLVAIGQCSADKPANGASISTQFVHARNLHCRMGPSTSEPIVRSMARNTSVQVTEKQGEWSFVDGSPGCWAANEYLSDAPSAEIAATELEQASDLMSTYQTPRQTEPDYEPMPEPAPRRQAFVETAYYPNCAAARAAGAAPVRRADPGYSARLDRDNDGVGCE